MRPLFKKYREGDSKTQAIFGYESNIIPDWDTNRGRPILTYRWTRFIFAYSKKSWMEFSIFAHSNNLFK